MKRRYFTEMTQDRSSEAVLKVPLSHTNIAFLSASGRSRQAVLKPIVFRLSDDSRRSPDVGWVERSRWNAPHLKNRNSFLNINSHVGWIRDSVTFGFIWNFTIARNHPALPPESYIEPVFALLGCQ